MTNPNQNGQTESAAVNPPLETEKRWLELEQKLNEYQSTLSLQINQNHKIKEIMNLDIDQLQALTAEDCGIYSILLLQYSSFLQKELNRHQAKNKWALHNLDSMVGKYGKDYGTQWTKLEERRLMLVADNSYAKALYDMIKLSSVIIEDFAFLSKKVELLSSQLSELQKTKRYMYEKVRNT